MPEAVKNCGCCGEEKPLADFYRHKAMKDGRLSRCKVCVRARVRQHRQDNLEKVRAYDRSRSKLPHRAALRKEITANQPPERTKARYAVSNAIRDGRLQKQPCKFCDTTTSLEAHHFDYARPLDVIWLCRPCHRKFHALERLATYRDEAA